MMKHTTRRSLPAAFFHGCAKTVMLLAMLGLSACETTIEAANGGMSCAQPGATTVAGALTTSDPIVMRDVYPDREPLYADTYRLTGQAGEAVTLVACGQLSGGEGVFEHTPRISFLNAAGEPLATNVGVLRMNIFSSGEFKILIRSTHFGDTGPYTLSVLGGRNLRPEAQAQAEDAAAARAEQNQQLRRQMQETLAAGGAAEQRGDVRGALNLYLAALQGNFRTKELWHAAIDSALKLQPPPPIPEEARRHAVFGDTAVAQAKSAGGTEGLRRAVSEYLAALKLAPWWAEGWLFVSAAREEIGDFEDAHADLAYYLRAAPRSAQRDKVQLKMYELEFKAQTAKKR